MYVDREEVLYLGVEDEEELVKEIEKECLGR